MHEVTFAKMKAMVHEYLPKDFPLRIADIGSRNVNGAYRPIFDDNPLWEYVGVDAQEGKNVDVVVDWNYKWDELEDESFDVVISGQTLEHVEAPWLAVEAMERICKKGGWCFISVPVNQHIHRYPIDCWRILPDGMTYLMTKHVRFQEIRNELYFDGVSLMFVGKRRNF